MRPFLLSLVAAIVLGITAAVLLDSIQQHAYEAYATPGTRVSDPGFNLVGSQWSGEPSGPGS
jgi:hypothetical protein